MCDFLAFLIPFVFPLHRLHSKFGVLDDSLFLLLHDRSVCQARSWGYICFQVALFREELWIVRAEMKISHIQYKMHDFYLL